MAPAADVDTVGVVVVTTEVKVGRFALRGTAFLPDCVEEIPFCTCPEETGLRTEAEVVGVDKTPKRFAAGAPDLPTVGLFERLTPDAVPDDRGDSVGFRIEEDVGVDRCGSDLVEAFPANVRSLDGYSK